MTKPDLPNYGRLRVIQMAAVGDGLLIFGLSYYFMNGFIGFDLVPAIISMALAGAVYGAVFYFGCLIFVPSLKDYIVSDDTKISGSNVEMITTTRESGDAELDRWIASFVFARNLFGMAIIPILVLAWLYFFG